MVEQPHLLQLATRVLMQFKDEPDIDSLCSLHLYFDQIS